MTISLEYIKTPLGKMLAGATQKGLCFLEFIDQKYFAFHLKKLNIDAKNNNLFSTNPYLTKVKEELFEYFLKQRFLFTVALDNHGTPFQQNAWEVLKTIPYGHAWTYKEQAKALNKPNAARAVANANAQNQLSIVVPCHRVVGTNSMITGYAGGISRKKWLLDFEKNSSCKNFRE